MRCILTCAQLKLNGGDVLVVMGLSLTDSSWKVSDVVLGVLLIICGYKLKAGLYRVNGRDQVLLQNKSITNSSLILLISQLFPTLFELWFQWINFFGSFDSQSRVVFGNLPIHLCLRTIYTVYIYFHEYSSILNAYNMRMQKKNKTINKESSVLNKFLTLCVRVRAS